MRALLACPPLALAAFALSTAALLGERLLAVLGRSAAAEPVIALLLSIGLAGAFGAFWLVGSLRLAGLVDTPAGRGGAVGAFATAGLGAILAPLELGHPAGDALALALSAACFATFFLLRLAPGRLDR
jgi:hypothetical protein